jgi:hypothetical protein
MSSLGTVSRGPYAATYDLRDGKVFIDAGVLGHKSAEVGRLSAEVAAGLLLRELIVEHERRKRSAAARSK